MKKNKGFINLYINEALKKYKKFMNTKEMPQLQIEVDNSVVFAGHNYSVQNKLHKLKVNENITEPSNIGLLYHEFTHIYDTDKYSGSSELYKRNRGFTEYHAAQIELLKILGAENELDKISFSLNDIINTPQGKLSVLDYIFNSSVDVKQETMRGNYPKTISELARNFGLIFNYLGRISVCREYAVDFMEYEEKLVSIEFTKVYFGSDFSKVISLVEGFLTNEEIEELGKLFYPMFYNYCKGNGITD